MQTNDADLTETQADRPGIAGPEVAASRAAETSAPRTAETAALRTTGPGPQLMDGIASGAALIAGLTLASRILGLVRTLTFSQTVGSGCLGTVYVTAYQVPNLLSELVLAGALTNAMVPVLARSAAVANVDAAARARVSAISSAMLTWTLLLLLPLTVGVVLAAGPIATILNPANGHSQCVRSEMVGATGSMLEVFAPQVVLYGLSVVIFGMLQAYRRFTGPALAPIIASLVLITAYLVFVPLDSGAALGRAPSQALLVLSVGTTLSVAALVVVGLVPMRRLGLRLRPTLRLPKGLAGRIGGLALVGVLEFVANDIAAVVIIILANGHGDTGALVVFNYATLVFNAVTAVLTLSITTSAFPVMSARDGADFDRTCAGSTRAVLLMSWLGTAAMAVIAVPAARVLVHSGQQAALIEGFIAFAPGIAGTAVITNLSRVMFALGRLRAAGLALTLNWVLVIALDWVMTQFVPAHLEVAALALGNTIGQTAVAIPLVIATRRARGRAAIDGIWHACIAGFLACVGASAAGFAVIHELLPPPADAGKLLDAGVALVAAAAAVVAFFLAAFVLDRGDLRSMTRQVVSRLMQSRSRREPRA
ncbi:MAG TPA: lipid II flippase MurJ [Trebonia sp.]|nr:lipid II flippase MurJ [Trebonia sp.]